MSLAALRKLSEEGVRFHSISTAPGTCSAPSAAWKSSGFWAATSSCASTNAPRCRRRSKVAESMRLSMRWAQRSRDAFGDRPGHALFGIQRAGRWSTAPSAEALKAIGFDGYAVGGLAVARGGRRCSQSSTTRPACFRKTSRAT